MEGWGDGDWRGNRVSGYVHIRHNTVALPCHEHHRMRDAPGHALTPSPTEGATHTTWLRGSTTAEVAAVHSPVL